jgi:hypothetical protein
MVVILQLIGPAAMVTARASGKASSSAENVLITSSLWEIDFDQDVVSKPSWARSDAIKFVLA